MLHKHKPSCAIITNRFLPTKGGFTPKTRLICNASKPSLAHKTDSTDLERSLVCMADKPHPTENRALLRHKMPKFRIAHPGRTAGNETPHVKQNYCTCTIFAYAKPYNGKHIMNTKNLKLYKKVFLLTMIILKSLHEQMFFTNFA